MLFLPVGAPKPMRVQGCYASDEEIEGVTNYIKKSSSAQYNAEIEEKSRELLQKKLLRVKRAMTEAAMILKLTQKWKTQLNA